MGRKKVVLRSGKFVKALPDPEWLIDGVLEDNGLVMLFGPPAQGKSFIALDIALHVASGKPWCGRDTLEGSVVYVTTEGISGLKLRLQAWEKEHGVDDVEKATYVLEPVQLTEEGVLEDLLGGLTALAQPVRLVIFDTFNRCFNGEENSSKDVGAAMARARWFARESGAALMIVHHTSKGGGYRGSSVLAGDMDTMLGLVKKDKVILLQCEKQKNAEAFEKMAFRFKTVELGSGKDGRLRKSAVMVATDAKDEPMLTPRQIVALRVLAKFGKVTPIGVWRDKAAVVFGEELSKRTFDRDRDALLDGQWIRCPRKGFYTCTDIGATLASSGQLPQTDVTDTPLLAEGVSAGVVH
jgi:hypothetical protein